MFKPEGFDPSRFAEEREAEIGFSGDIPEDHLDDVDPDLAALEELEDEDFFKKAA